MPLNPQDVHVDQYLSAVSIRYTNEQLVGTVLFPRIAVKKQSDRIATFGKEHFHTYDDLRAPGTPANQITHSYGYDTYFCEPHSLKEAIPDEITDNADDPFSPLEDSTSLITEALLLNQEIRIRDAINNNASIPKTDISATSVPWDQSTSTNPDKDIINTAVARIHADTYKMPNTMIIPFEVACALTTNHKIQDLVKMTQNILNLDGVILLPKKLWGLDVHIAGAGVNNANIGQAENLSYIWGKNVYIAYVNPKMGPRNLTFGLAMQWKQRETKRWYDQNVSSTYIQVEEHVDEKFICPYCCHVLQNVIS